MDSIVDGDGRQKEYQGSALLHFTHGTISDQELTLKTQPHIQVRVAPTRFHLKIVITGLKKQTLIQTEIKYFWFKYMFWMFIDTNN